MAKPRGYWTYEHCKEEAQKYNGRIEFRRNSRTACEVASKHKWLDDFFPLNVKPLGYWNNYEHCYEEALKYFSRNSFKGGCSRAYTVASKNGWLDDYYWMRNRKHEGSDYWVYVYEDVENKAVYVGLTFRKRRHWEHKNGKTDTVRLYFESIGKHIPEPRIKMDSLNAEDAQYYEDWYKEKYAEAGWTVINRGKTGVGSSSLGNVRIKWDYEHCKEEASKYKTQSAFQRGCSGAYGAARRNGWLHDFSFKESTKPNGYWQNYDNCKEEAMKYETRRDFEKWCASAYYASLKNGWIDDFEFKVLRKQDGYWDYEHCKEEASKYKTKSDFQKGCGSAYHYSIKNGWINDFGFKEGKRPNGYWTYERCKQEAKKYRTKDAFQGGCSGAYGASCKNGWLDDFFQKAA